ncbi:MULTISPECIES: LysR family transcriptional regulator [unclassified Rhizobium]|uniref:LysR family transcriptional regulator n=1 Tax=unclassified Rhizobium TaxID=2613769 RepID=UPI001049B0CB|nr:MULTISPECIES: LysR family transcriptional regulator [unclassified Rhizobium]MBB3398678.1 DNA-binding transcriptional LysR family regulator [Rhizobium sp. BK060]MBB4170569.1 DNA-binding transcriptional LysR family regulator [Rhizobium sp. BK538]TCM69297.1 LysR family transcriptional regulator [Rhizobium sp. BK068]
MDNRAGEMQVFLRVVEAGNFSEAARLLLMTPSTVSKLITRIETRLGVRLLERSTRRLSLTAEGQIYYERSQALLGDLDEVERELSQGAAATGGTVRVNASVAFGILGVEPALPAFWKSYPNIVVDLSLSDEIVDLYLDRTDVAIRVGRLSDSGMMARRIGAARRKIVAAPAYLERNGIPRTAEDLGRHNCLGFNFRRAAPVWPLKESGRIVDRAVSGSLLANNGETVRRMAVAGVGLARLGDYHARADLLSGRLVEVLADIVENDEEEIHAVYLGGARLPQRVRVFLDFMVPRLQAFLGQ